MRISDWSSDVCSSDLNAGGALVREQDTTDIGIGDNVEIGPVADWTEEGARRREASALPRRGCLIPNAAMRNGIDMVDVGNARRSQFFGGVQHRFAQWITRGMNADLERSARAAPFVRPQLMIFQRTEMAAHDIPAPAGAAAFRPMKIGRAHV